MASVLSRIQIILEANTANYNNELRRARENTDSTFTKMKKGAAKMALGAGAAIAGLGVASLKVAGNFESAMGGVQAVSNATGKDFEDLRNKAKELGSTTAFSATEAANGMEFLAMSGMKTKEVLATIPHALSLAAAGGLELAASADIMSNIMTGLGLKADESGRAADVLAAAASNSNVNISMLGESMKYVAPIAKQLGMGLEETAAMVGVLGNAGIQGSEAGTALRSVYSRFSTDKKALGHFKKMGIDIKDANGKMKSMTQLTGELAVGMKDMKADERLKVFKEMAGTEAMSALAVSVDAMADGSLPKLQKELENSEGAAKRMADIRMSGLNGELKGLASAWEGFLIELSDGGALSLVAGAVKGLAEGLREVTKNLPETIANFKQFIDNTGLIDALTVAWGVFKLSVESVIDMFNSVGEWISKHEQLAKVLEAVGLAVGIVAGALAIYTGLQVIATAAAGAFFGLLALATSPITLVIVALTALTAAGIYLYQNWDTIKAKASEVWDSIKNKVSETVNSIKSKFTEMVANSSAQFKTLVAVFTAIFNSIKVVVTTALKLISNAFKTGFNVIKALVRGDMKGVVDAIKSGFSNAVKIVGTGVTGIINVFKTLGTKLYTIGKDAIQGFINGIKEKFTGALSAVTGFVDKIKNAFTRTKGLDIHSPSRVTKEYGKNTGDGFTIGLQSTIGKAIAVADTLVSGIKASFDVMKGYTLIEDKFNLNKAIFEANKSVVGSIQSLRKEIVLFGNDSKLSAFEYEVAFGSLKHATKEYIDEYRKGLIEIERLEANALAKDTATKSLQKRLKDADTFYKAKEEAYKSFSESLLTEDEKRLAVLKEQLALIDAMGDASNKSLQAAKVLSSLSTVGKYQNVYNTDTRSTAEANIATIRDSGVNSEMDYNRQLADLQKLEQTREVEQAITDLEMNQAEKRRQIQADTVEAEKALYAEKLDFTSQTFGTMTDLVKGFTGENSRASKAMFAIEKAHTLASIMLKSKEAIAQAWASAPFPNNLGAVAMATLKTGVIQSAANAIKPSGQAHNGLANVPKEGTYILDKNERVVRPSDNNKLTKFLDNTDKGVGNNITTHVTITGNNASVESNNAMGKELGNAINAAIQKQLRTELRQGGMLSR